MDGEEEPARLEDFSLLFLAGDVEAHLGLDGARVAGEEQAARAGAIVGHDVLDDVGIARGERPRSEGGRLVFALGRRVDRDGEAPVERKKGREDRREVLLRLLAVDFAVARVRVSPENDDHAVRLDLLHELPDALVLAVHGGGVFVHRDQQTRRQGLAMVREGVVPDIEFVFVLCQQTRGGNETGAAVGELARSREIESSGAWEPLETVRSLLRPMK